VIRAATESDLPAILDMGARFYATTTYAQLADYCRDSAAGLARVMLDGGVLLIAEHDGRPIGMVGLLLGPFLFNAAHTTAHEVMWWVDPEARDSGAGVALLRALEPACRAKGAAVIQMMTLDGSPPQAAALYERLGYRPSEHAFSKRL
jgi:GNAT superfamily N-acetyltransferase